MANDREQELERLEKELLAGIDEDDDLLADIPIELLDTAPVTWEDSENLLEEELYAIPEEPVYHPESPVNNGETMKQTGKKSTKKAKAAQRREDKWVIALMIVASFLCVGIIGVLIYWLEVFLK